MLPPGHIAVGYLTAKVASQFMPALNQPKFLLLTSFFAFFPDLDFFLAFFKIRKMITSKSVNHRRFVTHAPLVYLVIFVMWYYIFPETRPIAWTFILGSWSHFLLDSFSAVGIAWLYPFSEKLYAKKLDADIDVLEQGFWAHWLEFVRQYTKLFSFKAEVLLIIIALLTFYYG